jgi:site-specific recombinase XerD
MSITIKPTLLKRKQKKNGTIPIYIRITENRKSRYKSTGIFIQEKYWNEDGKNIRKSHRSSDALNRKIERMIHEIQEKKMQLEDREKLNLDNLKKTLEENRDLNLITTHLDKYHTHLVKSEMYWTQRHFKVVIRNINRYIKTDSKSNILLDLDSRWLEDFQEFLLTKGGPADKKGNRKGNSSNTVRKKLQRLHGFISWLIQNKVIDHDPFTSVKKVETDRSNTKTKLTYHQIEALKVLELKEESSLWHTRNFFLFSFYNAGIRFGDLCALKWENLIDGRLTYSMFKTGRKKSIKQIDPMLQILEQYRTVNSKPEDYIFPILDQHFSDPMELRRVISIKNVLINKRLKKIAKKAGIQSRISFHVSRHSFAHYALKKGMDLYSISKALGHSDLKITEQYLKSFDEEKLDADMEGIFS